MLAFLCLSKMQMVALAYRFAGTLPPIILFKGYGGICAYMNWFQEPITDTVSKIGYVQQYITSLGGCGGENKGQ